MKIKKNKQEGDFWLRATTLANLFGQNFGVDVAKLCNYKTKLLKAYQLFRPQFEQDGYVFLAIDMQLC